MRFLVDMNLPPAVAVWLRAEGHDAVHVLDAGFANAPDREIFAHAAEEGRIVVTSDLDFGEILGMAHGAGSGAILLRLRVARQPYLRDRLRVAIVQAAEALEVGAIVLVEDSRIRVRRMPPGVEPERGNDE
jgi:predicted nuclease of predicted toxin-antitoxin system